LGELEKLPKALRPEKEQREILGICEFELAEFCPNRQILLKGRALSREYMDFGTNPYEPGNSTPFSLDARNKLGITREFWVLNFTQHLVVPLT